MKKNSTKNALISSLLMLTLCVSMLVGTTFAWFTDSAVSGRNTIQAGNLDVELEYKTSLDGEWAPVTEETKLFKEGALYEPGYTEVVFLRVANEGSLALKYNLNVNVYGETKSTNVAGEEFALSDYLEVGYYAMDESLGQYLLGTMFGTREAALKNVTTNKLSADTGIVRADAPMLAGEDTALVAALVLTMPETVGNEANHKTGVAAPTIDLGVSLVATQYVHESDSFDNQYDADASLDDVLVKKNITLTEDKNAEDGMILEAGDDVTLNLNNHELSGTYLQVNGKATIKDGTLATGDSANYGLIVNNGAATIKDVDVVSGGGGIGATDGAQVTFNSGSVAVNSTSTSGRYNVYAVGDGTVVTINDGEFSFSEKYNQKRAYIYAGAGATVYVNGGEFGKASTRDGYTAGILGDGTVIIKGGTFGFNPTNWVADGYEATEVNGVWTVAAVQ